MAGNAAGALSPLFDVLFETGPPVRFEFWDGSGLGPMASAGSVHILSADALRRISWSPGELGLARAFVAGDLEIRGNIFEVLRELQSAAPRYGKVKAKAILQAFESCRRLGIIGRRIAPPPEEAMPRGLRHSQQRDSRAVRHHYDVGNDFYRLVLGKTMVYSCARFVGDDATLEQAQEAKNDLVCRKLGLHERRDARLLDVGCGWGTMAIHAASKYGSRVVGVTLSAEQAHFARQQVKEAALEDRVEIRVEDYRNLGAERFDAVSSIGMFEHVGTAKTAEYFHTLFGLLSASGRLLNHAISSGGGSKLGTRSFMGRYVFPDAELIDVGEVVLAMERAGFEVRDVESLREHYSKTLHAWVANLESNWEDAVEAAGGARARIWRLYMAGSANGFDDGGISVHQVLAVKQDPDGRSQMPATRIDWS
jgi:cyclopropane-fatty-acyl-phospholipid synthase